MSLGVRHLWRLRRHASLAPRISLLIPRELPHPFRSYPIAPAASATYSCSRSLPAADPSGGRQGLCDGRDSNGEIPEQSSGPLGVAVNRATGTAAKASAVFSQDPAVSRQFQAQFFERLSRLPICGERIPAPVVVKRPTKYSHPRERTRDIVQSRKSIAQHDYHNRRQSEHLGSETEGWRGVLRKLASITPVYSPLVGSIKILVPEESVELLTTDRANNIWAVKSRTGCSLELHSKNPQDPHDSTYILVSGEKSAIDRAVRDFVDLCQQIRITYLSRTAAAKMRETASPVFSRSDFTVPRRYYLSKGIDEIEKPEQWTMATFEHYIMALIASRLPAGLHSEIGDRSHVSRVAEALLDAFHDPATASATSLVSFKLALRFLCSWGDGTLQYATDLVSLMMSAGVELDSEVYDLVARIVVKVNKLEHFRHLVNQMDENGYRPSLQTWIHFIRLVKDEGSRRTIVRFMDSKGLLSHPSAMPDLATELVEHDIKRAVLSGLDVDSFVASQNALYGPQWLHWKSSNKVLDVLGGYGRFDDIHRFLDYMFQSPSARPKIEVALNIILTHCKNQRKLDAAVSFVKRFEEEPERELKKAPIRRTRGKSVSTRSGQDLGALKTDYITYHLLAEIAWNLKKPHMFSVLCRHSYLLNHTSRRITIRTFELATSRGYTKSRKKVRSFLGRLKIAGTIPGPKPRTPDNVKREAREKSDRMLVLVMQNLLLCDYKEAHGIGQDQLLTDEEVELAVKGWYRHSFGGMKGKENLDKLGNILERALEEDRRNRADSHSGAEIALRPLSLTKPAPLEEKVHIEIEKSS